MRQATLLVLIMTTVGYYNHVDGWKCRRIKDKKQREACWRSATDALGKCQREDCDRYGPITTLQVF